jgi:catechol 2,3-dioxygenase-like lactoylglutathione lyase family enzyme
MSKTNLSDAIGTIDHVVITVGDLTASADIYRRLGFTLSPKGVHGAALGTENHTIMLRDDYFELLAVAAPTDRNAHWRQVIDQRGGVAGMAMTTREPYVARDYWLAQGLAPDTPIKFSRAVPRPDGSVDEARFEVVSLAEIPDTGLRLFVCSQPTREAVWLPELLEHANSAFAILRLVLACPDADRSAAQWQRVLPAARSRATARGVTLDTGRHSIELVRQNVEKVRALGIDFAVADVAACTSSLVSGGIPYRDEGDRITVRPEFACNVAITFESVTQLF